MVKKMTMTMLTVLQIVQALVTYSLVTLVLPGILLHKRLAGYRMSERLIGYFLISNFYLINLVFLLQFLHLSYPVTLWIGTLAPFGWKIWKKRKQFQPVMMANNMFKTVIHVLRKELGIKTLLSRKCKAFSQQYSKQIEWWLAQYWPDLFFLFDYGRCVLYLWNKHSDGVWL